MTTIPELLTPYREYLQYERKLAPSTVRAYIGDLRRLNKFLSLPVEQITRNHLRAFIRHLGKEGFSTATVRRTIHGFGTFWKWLFIEGHVSEVATQYIELPRKNQDIPAWMSQTELRQFIASTEAAPLRDSVAWRLLAFSGIRPDELRNLTVGNVNLSDGVIVVRNTKSRRDRVIPLNDSLRGDLHQLTVSLSESDYVFGSNGQQWQRSKMYKAFERQLESAGLGGRGYTPYTLRHSFATHLAMSGISIHVLKELLGHRDISTTAIYLHASPTNVRDAMQKYFATMEMKP